MVINPYADQIEFPANTPTSIINTILAIRDRQRQQQNQPQWWEQGINNILGVGTNLLGGWLSKNLIDLPYQQELNAYKTDQDIRQNQAASDALTQAQLDRARNAEIALSEAQTGRGEAVRSFLEEQKALTQPSFLTDTGITPEYGSFEDPWSTSPGPQFEEPTPPAPARPNEIQGEISPTGRNRIVTSNPGYTPSIADVLREQAGKNPLYAGKMTDLLKDPEMLNMFDPLKLRERAQAADKARAEAESAQKRASAAETTANARMFEAEGKRPLYEAQAALAKSKTATEDARALEMAAKAKTAEQITMVREQLIEDYKADRISEKAFQMGMAIIGGQQLKSTPTETTQRAFGVAERRSQSEGTNKPSKEGRIARLNQLKAREALGEELTPMEQVELAVLSANPDLQPKPKTGLAGTLDAIKNFQGGKENKDTSNVTPPGPDGRIKVKNLKTGGIVWIRPESFDSSLYERK